MAILNQLAIGFVVLYIVFLGLYLMSHLSPMPTSEQTRKTMLHFVAGLLAASLVLGYASHMYDLGTK